MRSQAIAERLGPGIGLERLRCAEAVRRHACDSNSNAQLDLDLGALRLVRDVSDRVERAPQVGNRLLVGAAAAGLGGGALVIGDGAHELVTALEMLRQLGRDRVQAAGPRGLQSAADPRMTERPARQRQAVVEKLAVKVVTESVKLGRRPVGPGGRAGLDDEDALPHQPRAGGFDRVLAGLQRGGNRGSREFAADDAGGGEQFTVAVIEVIDLPVDEAAHVVRDRHDRAGRRRRRGCTAN